MNKRQKKKQRKRNQFNVEQALEYGRQTTNYANHKRREGKSFKSNCQQYDKECGSYDDTNLFGRRAPRFLRLQELDYRLPSLRSTTESFSNLINSKRLLNRDKSLPDKFNEFMSRLSLSSETNKELVDQMSESALIYGRAGVRWLSEEDGIDIISSDRYTIVFKENEKYKVVNEIDGYVVARPGLASPFGETYFLAKGQTFDLDMRTRSYGYNDDYIYVPKEDFYNFHYYGTSLIVDTPLNHDLERIELFLQLVTQLKVTLSKSNSEVAVVKLVEDLYNLTSKQASELVGQSENAKDAQNDSIINQVKTFADTVAQAIQRETLVNSPLADDINIIPPAISIDNFTELYDYIETFISKLYGLSGNVLTLENMPRDASANPIFEQMMKTSIYPKRKVMEEFYNNFICPHLKIDSVHFEEESYAIGLKTTNAQNVATIVATLPESVQNSEDVKRLVSELIVQPLLNNI